MLKQVAAGLIGLAAASGAAAQDRCQSAPALRAVSDLRFGRLVIDRQGGTALLSSGECTVSGSGGAAQLATADVGCAEFELDGGVARADQAVTLTLVAPRTTSFGGAGSAQISRLTLSDDGAGPIGGSEGASGRFTVRLDSSGRRRVRVGAQLRILQFSPGEVRAPVTLTASYLGCPT